MNPYPHMLSPITIGGVTFKNRVWSAPAGTHRLDEGDYPSEAVIAYYARKARGGTACVTVSAQNMSMHRPADGIHSQKNIFKKGNWQHWAKLTDKIHFYGAKASLELLAFVYHDYNEAGELVAYTATGYTQESGAPSYPLTRALMEKIADHYADAAEAAVACGFDVLLIHAGHGVVLSQMMSPLYNTRTDEFGGSFENRLRFTNMVLDAIRARVGRKILIEFRISGSELAPEGGFGVDDCVQVIRAIQDRIDIAHISAGSTFSETEHHMHPSIFLPAGCNAYLAAAVKADPEIRIPVLTLGAFQDPALIDQIIAEGKADLVAMARGTIADPDVPVKAAQGRSDEIIPCLRCFHCLDYVRFPAFACSVNPETGRETWPEIVSPSPAARCRKLVIIGGGPAGMQCAITAARRGHDVTILEKDGRLGGKINFARQVYFKKDLERFLDYQIRMVQKLGVRVCLNTPATPALLKSLQPDAVAAAVGSRPLVPPIPGIDGANVIPAETCYALAEQGRAPAGRVAVLGGGQVGCETALFLAALGCEVTILEMQSALAADDFWLPQWALMEEIDKKAKYILSARCTAVEATGLRYTDTRTGEEGFLPADTVILSAGMVPAAGEAEAFRAGDWDFFAVGDCVRARNVRNATRTGYDAAMQI